MNNGLKIFGYSALTIISIGVVSKGIDIISGLPEGTSLYLINAFLVGIAIANTFRGYFNAQSPR